MSSSVVSPQSAAAPTFRATSSAVASISLTTWVLYALVFSSACIVIGLIWDISWHMTVGRDTLWTAPHVLEQIGASVAGLASGALTLKITFAGTDAERARSVRVWGFRAPLGAWLCIWGSVAMISSVPFDNWWHNAYGLDVQILSPPHMVLAAGMWGIQIGAMIMALGAQNRATARSAEQRRFGLMYVFTAGVFLTMMAVLASQFVERAHLMHGSMFYKASGVVFPFVLLGVALASRLRWPATATAAVYTGITLAMLWILPLFPATPKLAPIYNPVTHMVPMSFPLLLIIPALVLDMLLHRMASDRKWMIAVLAGSSFVLIMLAVHWFWADFMLSPYARNRFFAADQWSYAARLGPWRYEYRALDLDAAGNFSPLLLAQGIGIAIVLAIVSSRIGLAWGSWMKRVQR